MKRSQFRQNCATTVVPDETGKDIVIDDPVSPVWLKGETAEQILQNLIDLALPDSELLLNDEEVTIRQQQNHHYY